MLTLSSPIRICGAPIRNRYIEWPSGVGRRQYVHYDGRRGAFILLPGQSG